MSCENRRSDFIHVFKAKFCDFGDSARSLEITFEESAACHSTVMHFLASHRSCDSHLFAFHLLWRENTLALSEQQIVMDLWMDTAVTAQQFLAHQLLIRWRDVASGRAGIMIG